MIRRSIAQFAESSQFKHTLTRYQVVPVELFRIAATKSVKLRDFAVQAKKNSRSFDYVLQPDGLIHSAPGDIFSRPNGMSLRPRGTNMWDVLSSYRGKCTVTILPAGLVIPPELVLIHEHGDHWSMQTAAPCAPSVLNSRLTSLLAPCEGITKDGYFTRYPIVDATVARNE